MSKHTPGPWKLLETNNGLIVMTPDYPDLGFSKHFREGDARLIAVAPEMLEAIERVLANLPSDLSLDGLQLESDLKDIVRKARGEK